jgi:hypothetical protein
MGSTQSGLPTCPQKTNESDDEKSGKDFNQMAISGRWNVSISAHLWIIDMSSGYKWRKYWVRVRSMHNLVKMWFG